MRAIAATLSAVCLLACSSTFAANQPNMEAALRSLMEARENLLRAAANKGGHRDKALEAVEQAIAEVRAGMAYRDLH